AVINTQETLSVDTAAAKVPVTFPPPTTNANWAQPGGVASNAPGHLALTGTLRSVWSKSAGKGSSSKGHLTASPIVYNGRIYTLDTRGQVRAFSASGGGQVWRTSTTPESEKDYEGFGGGLAIDNGRLYVTTGYGLVLALNPANGSKIWQKKIGIPIRSSPTAQDNRIFFVTTEGRFFGLDGGSGEEILSIRGIPESASLLTSVSPAVSGDNVVVPFASGDVTAYKISSNTSLWTESLTRRRVGASLSGLNDPARPVIVDGVVYAVGHGGRMIATAIGSGERIWTQNISSTQMPAVAGKSVFVVDSKGRLVALTRATGKISWMTELPKARSWSGPILAGGKLWAVSSEGLIVGTDAATGKVLTQRELKTRVLIPPIVASGRMYIYTDKAKLIALN
ncbi:MAG: PQQ-binding-like beta-propeller repeat protein, partial [Methyloligellaceae bacterium]